MITGNIAEAITRHGAIIDVLVGVGKNRRAMLEKMRFPVAEPVPLRVELDTGSGITGFLPFAFQSLKIEPFGTIPVRTTTGEDECDQYDVRVTFLCSPTRLTIPSVYVIAGKGFLPQDVAQGIIGRDILAFCNFHYLGKEGRFTVDF